MDYGELLENPALVHLLDARDIVSALQDAQRYRKLKASGYWGFGLAWQSENFDAAVDALPEVE